MYVVRKHEEIIEQLREFGVFSDVAYNNLPEEGESFMYLRDLRKPYLRWTNKYCVSAYHATELLNMLPCMK